MRKLSVLTFVTLDGVMQAPMSSEEDTSGGFRHGGWTLDYYQDVMAQVQREAMSEPFDLLFGRKTFDSFAAHWSKADAGSAAEKLNTATKYVATSSPGNLGWINARAISGDIAAEVAKLKNSDGPLLQVHGSSQLIQTLVSHDLVDEYRQWIFPLIVGAGKRLFEAGALPQKLNLLKTQSAANGVIMAIYGRNLN